MQQNQSSLPIGQKIQIDPSRGSNIQIALQWSFHGAKTDIDASVIMIDDCGAIMDAVYYNKLLADDGSISHSGDSKDGVIEGYDEVIAIDLSKINFSVSYLAVLVNAFSGQGFSGVSQAGVSIWQGGNKIDDFWLKDAGDQNAVMSAVLFRTNPTWSFVNVNAVGSGTNFQESNDLIMNNLTHAGFDPVLLLETKGWQVNSGSKFNMKKDDAVNIPDSLRIFKIGLGWDTRLDLDCSVLLFDK